MIVMKGPKIWAVAGAAFAELGVLLKDAVVKLAEGALELVC